MHEKLSSKVSRRFQWGYDADVMNFFERTSQSNIVSHAVTLLGDLVLERETPAEKERRIIFAGHNLGGLVIKELPKLELTVGAGRNFKAIPQALSS